MKDLKILVLMVALKPLYDFSRPISCQVMVLLRRFFLFFCKLSKSLICNSCIFLPNLLALSVNNLGSARQTIGSLISVQNLEVQSCIIKSGPIPEGSPGEYIIFFNLNLLSLQKLQLS